MSVEHNVPIPPAWFKPGLLPRRTAIGECCPLFREKIDVIPEREWSKYIGKIALRHLVWKILYQRSVGSCASEGATQTLQISRESAGLDRILLNPYSLYHYTSYGHDGGSSLDDNLRLARGNHPRWPGKGGIAPQSIWPRSKGWRKEPSEEARVEAWKYRIDEFFDITNKTEFGTALLKGFAVYFGYPGHAICGVSLVDKDTILYANSWDDTWGDKGFGTIRFRSVQWSYGVFAIRTSLIPSGESVVPPKPSM